MRLPRRANKPARRERRSGAFRSTDLTSRLRRNLDPWFRREGFRHLGARAWTREDSGNHLIVAVQCRQSGWDPSAGSEFVVEFELSDVAKPSSGFHRDRIWRLLPEPDRDEALRITDSIAQTLPAPDNAFVAALPSSVRDHYLSAFAETSKTSGSSDVWFRYYDERDADLWAAFLQRTLGDALERFLAEPPSFLGYRPDPADTA